MSEPTPTPTLGQKDTPPNPFAKAMALMDTLDGIESLYESWQDVKLLVYGPSGGGKTHLIGSYTKGPIILFSFDPGGHITLKKSSNPNIKVLPFYDRDIKEPKAWQDFANMWNKMSRDKVFEYLGSVNGLVALDSITTLSDAIMAPLIKANSKNKPGDPPQQQDYLKQMTVLQNLVREFNALPCSGICTAHEEIIKDETVGKTMALPLVTGKLKGKLGIYFSEVYSLGADNRGRYARTRPDGIYKTDKTRIFSPEEGKIEELTLDKVYDRYMQAKADEPQRPVKK